MNREERKELARIYDRLHDINKIIRGDSTNEQFLAVCEEFDMLTERLVILEGRQS